MDILQSSFQTRLRSWRFLPSTPPKLASRSTISTVGVSLKTFSSIFKDVFIGKTKTVP